ncbi:unnamed protein product [Fusarium equiseti]|uniref:Cyclin-dependent kinase inhibitor 1c n=1 Tax=Fusarium equiseti TaxID=61235 RepID=A0A8J2NAQ7_FUSEQ|nr:unnamed protein product [Fusarium equiseti]
MRHNVLAVMALVNGLAQANRFSWQSNSETDVSKQGLDNEFKSNEVLKPDEDKKWVGSLLDDEDDKKIEEEKKQSKYDHEKLKKLKEKLEKEGVEEEEEEEYETEEKEHKDNKKYDPEHHKEHHGHHAEKHKHHGDHYNAHHYKKPYVIDGKKYDYIHKPIVEHHTYTKYHDPKLSPKCYGDRCDRKPCKECGDDWAQPGCWHCKNHEGNYGEAAKTTKYAPEKTGGEYENAKTYTHKGVTVIVPKQTKVPEKPKEQPKKVVVVVEEEKKKEKEKDICHKVVKGYGENKYEETVCDKIKYHKEPPKQEHKHQDICRKIVSGDGKHRKEEIVCERIEHQKEQPKVHYEPKKEDICDKIKGCPAPAPKPYHPAPAPAPEPQYPEVKPVPAPAPQPQYPKKEEDICDKIKGCPAPAPAPEPQPPKVEPMPAPPPMPEPEEIKPVPVPAPAPPQPPVPVQPEQVRPQGEGSGEAPRVPLTVSKSGASFNSVSIAGTLVVGIVGMMLL